MKITLNFEACLKSHRIFFFRHTCSYFVLSFQLPLLYLVAVISIWLILIDIWHLHVNKLIRFHWLPNLWHSLRLMGSRWFRLKIDFSTFWKRNLLKVCTRFVLKNHLTATYPCISAENSSTGCTSIFHRFSKLLW